MHFLISTVLSFIEIIKIIPGDNNEVWSLLGSTLFEPNGAIFIQ